MMTNDERELCPLSLGEEGVEGVLQVSLGSVSSVRGCRLGVLRVTRVYMI